MSDIILQEYRLSLYLRIAKNVGVRERVWHPRYWDFTELLELDTGVGEQAWFDDIEELSSGTEEKLEHE